MEALTVEQMIAELQKIENKKLKIYFERDSCSVDPVIGVNISRINVDEECVLL